MSDKEIATQNYLEELDRQWTENYKIKHFVTDIGRRSYGTFGTERSGQNTEYDSIRNLLRGAMRTSSNEAHRVAQDDFEDEDLWMTN